MKLGKREIDQITCPPGRRDMIVFDDVLPGFGLRVTANGTKTFLLQYQLGGRGGRRVRMVLGRFGDLTPAEARKLAEVARGKVLAGIDPDGERRASIQSATDAAQARRRQAQADANTLDTLIGQWASLGLSDRSESHRQEAPRAIRACFAGLLTRPAHDLDAATAQRAIDGIAVTRPVMARRARDYARAMFNWAVRRRLVPSNPFAGVAIETRERSRDRVLSDGELGEAWRGAVALSYPFGPFLRLLMLTLQRRGEVAGMQWGELSADLTLWTIPAERTKNGKAHVVHLPEQAREVLAGLPRQKNRPLIFSTVEGRPISGFSNAKERLQAWIGRERVGRIGQSAVSSLPPIDWRLHDFRRTGVTALARLGFAPHVADRLLNHVEGTIRGVAAVYQRHDFLTERAAASAAWAAHVLDVARVPQATGGAGVGDPV